MLRQALAHWPYLEAQMPNHETPAERYQRLAIECQNGANNFPPGDQRDVLLQMAQVWQRLADQSQDATPRLFPVGEAAEQPPMQQQQQIQPKDQDDKS